MEQFDDVKIIELKNENMNLQKQIIAMQDTLHEFYTAYCELIKLEEENQKENAILNQYIRQHEAILNNLKYEFSDSRNNSFSNVFLPKFRSNAETIRLIVEEKKSLARFGDGEFSIAFDIPRQKFQKIDSKLKARIWEVLNTTHPQLILAIADQYGNLDKYNDFSAYAIRIYMTDETRKMHRKILSDSIEYSDAYITRPYVLYKDVFTEEPKKRFESLKRIWEGKRVMVVEGAQTRLGVRNDLFAKAVAIYRILAPATNSFDQYDNLLKECLKHADNVDLFLLAIGPSSGILAYDLTVNGYQAVDVGHIDLEYEWFLAGKGTRVSIPYKYNNEIEGGDVVEAIHDDKYESQIVASYAD